MGPREGFRFRVLLLSDSVTVGKSLGGPKGQIFTTAIPQGERFPPLLAKGIYPVGSWAAAREVAAEQQGGLLRKGTLDLPA